MAAKAVHQATTPRNINVHSSSKESGKLVYTYETRKSIRKDKIAHQLATDIAMKLDWLVMQNDRHRGYG